MTDLESDENAFTDQDATRGSSYYYRGQKPPSHVQSGPYIDPDRFQNLYESHARLTNALAASFIFGYLSLIVVPILLESADPKVLFMPLTVVAFAVGLLLVPTMKKVGAGLKWSSKSIIPVSILLGLNVMICGGAIGFIIVQQLTGEVLKKHGLKVNALALRKKDAIAITDDLRRRKLAGETEIRLD